jgi:hypothetical protein
MLTNQLSGISLTGTENPMISDTVKRTRVESPPKTREVSKKKPKNEYNQILMIEDQKSSDVTLLDMINVLTKECKNKRTI